MLTAYVEDFGFGFQVFAETFLSSGLRLKKPDPQKEPTTLAQKDKWEVLFLGFCRGSGKAFLDVRVFFLRPGKRVQGLAAW